MSLSTSDVAGLAETLAQGKHPKVVFTDAAGQIAGKVGKVVRLEEPAEGDFVVVRFGHDELPFTTAELRVPARGEFSRKNTAKQVDPPPVDTAPPGAPLLSAGVSGGQGSSDSEEGSTMSEVEAVVPAQGGVPPARKKAPKAKTSPELTVTLAWKDGEWSVSASKGTKVIAKPVPVRASAAVSMVEALDSPAVAAVVEDIVDQQRQQAAEEAERLRQQLAEIEAKLAELS
ncbi:hypothetical protein [Stackebrandtia soli]|uniref:hypothetical protein n=1 Tax=Stackebrandtia soli TaxID=1892856 RepID=UPI0039EC822C